MLQLKHPGVYTQELPSGVRTITGASTSVALFIGPTLSGIDDRKTRVQNFGDFERAFGGLSQTSNLSYSVMHFFANGGSEAFVIRVPANGAKPASSAFKQNTSAGAKCLTVTALGSGVSSKEILVEFDPFDIGADPYGAAPVKTLFNMTLTDRVSGQVERFTSLSTSSSSARFAPNIINDEGLGSRLVKLEIDVLDSPAPKPCGSVYQITTPPSAGTFSADIKLKLSVEFRKSVGTVDAANSISDLEVVVFKKDAAQPVTALELATKLQAALAAALAGSRSENAKMKEHGIEVLLREDASLLHLRIAPGGPATTERRADGRVSLADPAAGTSFLTTYGLQEKTSNPTRHQLGQAYASSQVSGTPVAGKDGDVHGQPASDAFFAAVSALEAPDAFFNILCLPDLVRPKPDDPNAPQHANYATVYGEAARICVKKFAFVLIDPPPGVNDTVGAEAWKSGGLPFSYNSAAAYFPNIRVDDPLVAGSIRSHPPSGALAGLYARTDGQSGIWQAPAGTDAYLSGVYGPSVVLSDTDHGVLNPIGLNVIRQFPIYGTVSFGSRTLDGADAKASEYKYIPVRRTASYILRSLSEALRWVVHRPNGEELWSQIRLNVTAFMNGMFRQGAFKGTSSREAFFVMCDASTTSPTDINQGIVNIVVGFAPLKPAEFVVISLRQIVQAAE